MFLIVVEEQFCTENSIRIRDLIGVICSCFELLSVIQDVILELCRGNIKRIGVLIDFYMFFDFPAFYIKNNVGKYRKN